MTAPTGMDTYVRLRTIGELNGFEALRLERREAAAGERKLPDCAHDKIPVFVDTFAGAAGGLGPTWSRHRGLYCQRCRRVYVANEQSEPK